MVVKKSFFWTKTSFLVAAAIVIAGLLVVCASILHFSAGLSTEELLSKVSSLLMQLAIFVIIGPMLKGLFDWLASEKERRIQERENKMDFIRRLRNARVDIEYSQQLISAQMRIETYHEQNKSLMKLRFEIEEIAEDLKASPGFFINNEKIIFHITSMASYIKNGGLEYNKSYEFVVQGGSGAGFRSKVKQLKWLNDFIEFGPEYQSNYFQHVIESKELMRVEVFG